MKSFLLLSIAAAGTLSANDMILESGPYKVVFSEKEFYSSAQYFYEGVEIGGRTGFYGTILSTTGPNQFIGAGHKEGGVEKIVSLKLTVDNAEKKVENIPVKAEKIVFDKVAMLGNLKLNVNFTLTPEGIVIRKQYEAVDAQPIYSFYIFQYCWSKDNDQWMIGRPDGTFRDGRFNSDEGWFLCRQDKEAELLWFAEFNSGEKKGILGYFSQYFPGQGTYMFWDRKVYHKFYFSAKTPKIAEKGYRSPEYVMVLKGFSSTPDAWQSKAKEIAGGLKAQFPPPPPPKVIEPEEAKDLTLAGNGKFLCRKLEVDLMPGKEYEISFRIAKGKDVSAKASDNSVLMGQYTRDRSKFMIFGSFASATPKDGEFQEVTGTFKTPAELNMPAVYIYNSNTADVLRVQNLRLVRKD